MKQSYSEFASVYDELMTEIPYDTYVDLIDLAANGIAGKKILDIGCGTGLLSVKLAKQNGLVTGVDISPDMLSVATDRAKSLNLPVTFVEQPMQQITGFSDFDVAVIAIDSLNYVIEEEEVIQTFRNIYDSLAVGGVLLFDVHSTFKTDVIFMESPFTFDIRVFHIFGIQKREMNHTLFIRNLLFSFELKMVYINDLMRFITNELFPY